MFVHSKTVSLFLINYIGDNMKPFLALNKNIDNENENYSGEEFIFQKPSEELSKELDRCSEQIFKSMFLPKPLLIVCTISAIIGLTLIVGGLRYLGGENAMSIIEMYNSCPWLFWLCGVSVLISAIIIIFGIYRQKQTLKNNENNPVFSELDNVSKRIESEFRVPINAEEIDIFSFSYEIKNGKIIIDQYELYNEIYKIYSDSEYIYLSNYEVKYAFAKSSLSAIRTVNKTLSFSIWNKEIEYTEEYYKQYNITEDNEENINIEKFHILEFKHNGETWGIYFPNYEIKTIEKITGLKAE